MLAFITVGSTRFDALVQAVFSSTVLSSLSNKGYARLVVQCGNSEFPYKDRVAADGLHLNKDGVQIECWKFKPSLQTEYAKADLVISHAGGGFQLSMIIWLSIHPCTQVPERLSMFFVWTNH